MINKLDAKLLYLYKMLNKYNKLNKVNDNKFIVTQESIQIEIDVLEELNNDEENDNWNECYEEDLKESLL